MSDKIIYFIGGLFIGAIIGFFTAAFLSAANKESYMED